MRRRSLALLLSTLLLAPQPWTARAFAEWTKCWTELEEGEIVMNQKVRRQDAVVPGGGGGGGSDSEGDGSCSSGSDGALVRLIVMDTNGRPVQPRRIRKEGVPAQDDAQNENAANNQQYKANRFGGDENVIPFVPGQTFHLKLESTIATSPNDDACTSSSNANNIAHLPANTQYLAQITDGGKFLGRAAMCDGTRAVGKKRDDVVRIMMAGGDDNEDNAETDAVVRVWAGYASEKAAVLLTPELVFRRYDTRSNSINSDGASGRIPVRVSSSPNPSPHQAPAPVPATSAPQPADPVHLTQPDL